MADEVARLPPVVSALCVTSRPACREWLRWNVQRQTYPRLDVVVIDASGLEGLHGPREFVWQEDAYEILPARAGRLIRAPSTWSCGELRNLAMDEARGDYFVWFDDDDWQHPERVQWLVDAIDDDDALWAGWGCGYIMDIEQERGVFLPSRVEPARVINGGAIYNTDLCRQVRYDDQPRASDARWLRQLAAEYTRPGDGLVLRDERLHAIWMRHGGNTSQTLRGGTMPLTLSDFAQKAGGWWGTTTSRLRLLRDVLR